MNIHQLILEGPYPLGPSSNYLPVDLGGALSVRTFKQLSTCRSWRSLVCEELRVIIYLSILEEPCVWGISSFPLRRIITKLWKSQRRQIQPQYQVSSFFPSVNRYFDKILCETQILSKWGQTVDAYFLSQKYQWWYICQQLDEISRVPKTAPIQSILRKF